MEWKQIQLTCSSFVQDKRGTKVSKKGYYFLAQSFANSSQNQACCAPSYLHGHGPLTDNFALLKKASCFSLTWACTKWPSWIPETRINAAKSASIISPIIGSSLLIDQANQLIMRSVKATQADSSLKRNEQYLMSRWWQSINLVTLSSCSWKPGQWFLKTDTILLLFRNGCLFSRAN